MKKILTYITVAMVIIFIFDLIQTYNRKVKHDYEVRTGSSDKPVVSSSKEVILIEVRKEPKVLEAIITDSRVLYVSVYDDGTRRDGYAEYLCQIAGGSVVNRVKVVKVNSQNDPNRDNSYGLLLGESWCK